jgi:hypothetical protein
MTEGRERLSRVDEVRQERRRRGDVTQGRALKLAIPADIQAKLEAQGRTPRWINDVGSRVQDLTVRDDWDVVEGVEPREVVIDRAKGATAKAILVSKPKAFIAEDAAKREAYRREREAAMLKGQVPGNPNPAPVYVDPASKIERGNQIL